MTVHAWALFCMMETLLCLSPGPSALLVISLALTRGQAAGFSATVGVLGANALYFALSASGLIALHSLSAEVFLAIKWVGAAYLIWLGMRMVVRSFSRVGTEPGLPAGVSGRRACGRASSRRARIPTSWSTSPPSSRSLSIRASTSGSGRHLGVQLLPD